MSTNPGSIADGKVVSFRYTLTNAQGEVLDESGDDEPFAYLHGADNIVPGLERQMAGKKVGDKFRADVSPEEGYGVRDDAPPQGVPRQAFPSDVELTPGSQFAAQGPDGDVVPVWIVKVDADQVFIDRNHPLAGESLHFDVEIMDIRDATREEVAHGHPHGPGGHHHH